MTNPSKILRLFLIAGEPSGDLLGARLMTAIRRKVPQVQFLGVGGERMKAEGQAQIFPLDDLAVMGLAEVLPRLPRLLKRMRQARKAILQERPDAVITIDAPDFNFRVARKLKGQGIPLIHYVAPTVWAWRPGRAKKIAQFLDHLLALFPFEPPYFTREGLPCTFVGHPLVETMHTVPAQKTGRHLIILPGSRKGEVSRLLPVFKDALALLKEKHPDLYVTVPTVSTVEMQVRAAVKDWSVPTTVVMGDTKKYTAFAAGDVALAASGTIALELALAGLPAVISYKVSALSVFLFRRLARVKYANLVNIMHDKMVVPELLQENCRADLLAAEVNRLLTDAQARQEQKAALSQVAAWLGQNHPGKPSDRAAQVVLEVVEGKRHESH